jgi:hypothetical protein
LWLVECNGNFLAKGVEINVHVALKKKFYVCNLDVVCGFEYYESNLSRELQ